MSGGVNPFKLLSSLFSLPRKRRGGSCEQPPQPYRLSGVRAITIASVIDTCQCLIDLSQQLALPITGSQFDAVLLLLRCAVRRIGYHFRRTQVFCRCGDVLRYLALDCQQTLPQKLTL